MAWIQNFFQNLFERDPSKKPITKHCKVGYATVMAIVVNEKTFYLNTYQDHLFTALGNIGPSFMGPVYRINLQTDRIVDIFYGIRASNRFSVTSKMNPQVIDTVGLEIIKLLNGKFPSLLHLDKFKRCPTHYTFYLERVNNSFFITNNGGSESFYIPLNFGPILKGTRSEISNYYDSWDPDLRLIAQTIARYGCELNRWC